MPACFMPTPVSVWPPGWLKQEGCLLKINPVFSRVSFQLDHKCKWWLEGIDLDILRLIEVISLAAACAWPTEGRAVF